MHIHSKNCSICKILEKQAFNVNKMIKNFDKAMKEIAGLIGSSDDSHDFLINVDKFKKEIIKVTNKKQLNQLCNKMKKSFDNYLDSADDSYDMYAIIDKIEKDIL